jgi:hypothetical protein
MSMTFETLIQQPESRRDQQWEAQFLDAILPMKVALEGDEPKPGPDGWPYLRVRTGGEHENEPFHRIVRWAAGRGIGLVVNAHKMMPDYVFTYGMLWNYLQTGRFVVPQPPSAAGEVAPGPDSLMGPPTEKYLPPYVREILRSFLAAQGLSAPKILVISTPDFKNIDLAFSVESLGQPAAQDQRRLAEALAWFLPLHYNLVMASEKGLPPFHSL